MQPFLCAGEVIKRNEAERAERIIFLLAVERRLALEIGAFQLTARAHFLPHEFSGVQRRRLIALAAEGFCAFRESGDHHAVPGGNDFLIAMRRFAFASRFRQPFAHGIEPLVECAQAHAELFCLLAGGEGQMQHARTAFEIAFKAHAERGSGEISLILAQRVFQLGLRPHIKDAFLALAIGIARGIKSALRRRHVVQHIIQRAPRTGGEIFLSRQTVCAHQRLGYQRLVVEHLFEMRHQPFLVHRIAVKAAPGLVLDAAVEHSVQSGDGGVERVFIAVFLGQAQQEQQGRFLGKFGRAAKAAKYHVEILHQFAAGALEHLRGNLRRLDAPGHDVVDAIGQLVRVLPQGIPLAQPVSRDLGQQRAKRAGRIICAGVKRLFVRRQKHRIGPAASAGDELGREHIGLVHVRAALAVDLDGNEAGIENFGDFVILKALARHHMAPVAGGIAHRQEDRLVLLFRLGERRIAPGVPFDRIVGVLAQIGRGFVQQPVRPGARARGLAHGEGLGQGEEKDEKGGEHMEHGLGVSRGWRDYSAESLRGVCGAGE